LSSSNAPVKKVVVTEFCFVFLSSAYTCVVLRLLPLHLKGLIPLEYSFIC
jgi:hypothetical protein